MRVKDYSVGDYIVCSKCHHKVRLTFGMWNHSRRICDPCQVKSVALWVKNNREKKRQHNMDYFKRHPQDKKKKSAEYRIKYPEKNKAHQLVQTAIRTGHLVSQPCKVCNNINSHAHHEDYSKPLNVEWLCHTHHMERHYPPMIKEAEKREPIK